MGQRKFGAQKRLREWVRRVEGLESKNGDRIIAVGGSQKSGRSGFEEEVRKELWGWGGYWGSGGSQKAYVQGRGCQIVRNPGRKVKWERSGGQEGSRRRGA